jgi:hypothetical protein
MIIYLTGKRVLDNQIIFEKAQYDHVPSVGLQYQYDGQTDYVYLFATWDGTIDSNFPPNVQGGTVELTYWYLQKGKTNKAPQLALASTLLLGGQDDDAVFVADNPISSVNGQAWSGGTSVSTAAGDVDIVAKGAVQAQSFASWIKLWGSCQIVGQDYHVLQAGYCFAAAVYSKAQKLPNIPVKDLATLVAKFVNPKDLVADFLDERLRAHLDQIVRYAGPSTPPDRLSKLLENVKDVSPQAARQALLQVTAEANRLNAAARLLAFLARQ